MIKAGILNPAINSLLSRVRHTNTFVIADRGFPFWPLVETVDISLVDDVPCVLDVIRAVLPNFHVGRVYMASEFEERNNSTAIQALKKSIRSIEIVREPHAEFKRRVPACIGLIRTGDTTQYANIIFESA